MIWYIYNQNQKTLNNFVIVKSLGRGSFSKVKKVIRTYEDDGGKPITGEYAFKKMHKPTLLHERCVIYSKGGEIQMSNNLDKVYSEINIWATLFHPNIARLYEVIDDPSHDYIYLVMELCDCGQLAKWSNEEKAYKRNESIVNDVYTWHLKGKELKNDTEKTEAVAKVLFAHQIKGLRHMHEETLVIHRDVKLDNLLYSSKDHNLKIIDFNVSYKLENPDAILYDPEGTISYRRKSIISSRMQ